jgi:carbohydrate-selective porin OprB
LLQLLLFIAAFPLFSQQQTDTDSSTDQPEIGTIFPHSENNRFWLAGQTNFIAQAHPSFPAKYSGPNSLKVEYEKATSQVSTLYTGVQLNIGPDLQYVENPGYNRDRGPVIVPGFRIHLEL